MNSVQPGIPPHFVAERVQLSWKEIKFALEKGIVDEGFVAELVELGALVSYGATPKLHPAARPLKGSLSLFVEQQANMEELGSNRNRERDKWIYLMLAWLYECRENLPDPLAAVEAIYADFDYPQEIASFVRYMPMIGPNLGSVEANSQRLMDRWAEYVERHDRIYSKKHEIISPGEDSGSSLCAPGEAWAHRKSPQGSDD